jgi:general secretion pathway protein F
VVGGERLSSALAHTSAVTASTVQLVRAGEATGDLAGMLEHAARIEGEWAEQRVKALVRIVEPVMILVFGVIVAVIAASLLQAVYSVRPVA